MTNDYYVRTGYPGPYAPGSSAAMRAELQLISTAFDKLPALSGNAGKMIAIKLDGTGLEAVDSFLISNITGNLTGNVTGNVTSSGSSTFNNVTITGTLNMDSGTGATITGLSAPQNDTDAATKLYVDTVAQGLDVKPSVRLATTENISLFGTPVVDGVQVVVGDRVLVKDQASVAANGIYVASAGAWLRSADTDAWSKLPGAFTFVEEGAVNDDTGWVCTVSSTGAIGSNAITFTQFTGAGQIIGGSGMVKNGNTLDVVGTEGRIVANANNIDLAMTGVTPGVYANVTVDAYGRVLDGAPDTFGAVYLGPKTSDPVLDNQNQPLTVGALYFNTTTGSMRVYTASSSWVDAGSSVNGIIARATYTATSGQTSFAITYDVGFVDVYRNGSRLVGGVQFIASNGTSIVLTSGATAGDVIDIVAFGSFALANHYTKAEADTLLGAKANSITPTITGLREVRAALSTGGVINLSTANYFTMTVSGVTTFSVTNVQASGAAHSFILDLTNGGSSAVTWWSGLDWGGGSAPTLTAAGRDVLGFFTHDGGATWTGILIVKDAK